MQERGTQARTARVRLAGDEPGPPRPDRFWPIIAIVAIVLATAGWTTTGVLMVTGKAGGGAPTSSAVPSDEGAVPSDSSEPTDVSSHEAPALEAMLPTEWEGIPLEAQSWIGENTLTPQEPWSDAMRAFIVKEQLDVAALSIAQRYDTNSTIDLLVSAFKLEGATPAKLMEGMAAAWSASDDKFKTSELTIAGKKVTKGVSTNTPVVIYWIPGDGVVFDVETEDAARATAVVKALITGVMPPPPSPSPSTSGKPSGPASS